MSTKKELHDAVGHIGRVTGDPTAWTKGLSPQETATVTQVLAPEPEIAAVLTKIKANHPSLFQPQSGAGVTAIKKAEGDLAQQNSHTAQVDLLVITAILNAHTTTERGSAELDRLQADIEHAVRTRTDLDTPAGARDFQRYLIGKLREIGAVVETAGLDDHSKATLATAWTALYEASRAPAITPEPPPARPGTSPSPPSASPMPALPPYSGDLGSDPLLEQLLAQGPVDPPAATAAPVPPPPPPAAPAMSGVPLPGVSGGGVPGLGGGLPAAPGWPRVEEPTAATESVPASPGLEELLAEAKAVLAEDDVPVPDEDEAAAEPEAEPEEPEAAPPEPESAQVRLPGGDLVTAPTPQLAKVITTALGGTPIGEAFHRHGLPILPPGSPVDDPVDPADVSTGDVGMFTDRQALALDRTRALLAGEIQPLASVSGPSFLGWMRPAEEATADPVPPAPTRPATTPAN